MKLKSLMSDYDRLKKVLAYIKSIDFTKAKHVGKTRDIFFGDYKTDNIYLYMDDNVDIEQLKELLENIIKKWWSNFESGIQFHTYVTEDYFIEVRQNKDDKNVWEFIVEAIDDSVYFKFNTNFVVNL